MNVEAIPGLKIHGVFLSLECHNAQCYKTMTRVGIPSTTEMNRLGFASLFSCNFRIIITAQDVQRKIKDLDRAVAPRQRSRYFTIDVAATAPEHAPQSLSDLFFSPPQ